MISDKLRAIAFGGHYSPELWPEPLWQEDVRLMRRAGVTWVTLGHSSWTRMEPTPGVFAFDPLDSVVELLAKNGVGIVMGSGTACPPAWLGRLHPESLLVTRSGVRLPPGGRHHYCPNSAPYRDCAARWVRALASRYGAHPAIVLWYVHNEHGNHLDVCYCDTCAREFRRWLQEKYLTLGALNEQWGTALSGPWYQTWEDVAPPRMAPAGANPAHQLDYHRFSSQSLLGGFLAEKQILNELSPGLPVTANLTGERGMPKTVNAFEWCRHLDVVWMDTPSDFGTADPADRAFALALRRGLGQGKPWVFVEEPAGQPVRRLPRPLRRPGQARTLIYQALAHGADGVLAGHWRAPRVGAEKFHAAMLPHSGASSESFKETAQLGFELKKFAQVAGSRIQAEVALVLDWENYWAVELEGRPARLDYSEIVRHFYRAMFEPDIAIDIIPPEADLSPYKLVVAPALYLVRAGVSEIFESFLNRGGTLVTSFFSGLADANDRVIPGGYPGAFRKLLGIRVEDMDPFPPGVTRHIRTAQSGAKCSLWGDLITLETAEAVANFTEEALAGHPALTRNACGRGLAYYLGTQIEPQFLRAFFANLCADSGIRPPLKVPEGIEVVRRSGPEGEFLFLLNHRPATLSADLGPNSGRDLATGRILEGSITVGANEAVAIHVGAWE